MPYFTKFEGYQSVKDFWDQTMADRRRKKNVLRISLEPKTWLCKYPDESYGVVYYETKIISYRSDGSILLDHDGYKTQSTKARMNMFLPKGFGVCQIAGDWYLAYVWKQEAIRYQWGGLSVSREEKRKFKEETYLKFSRDGTCCISCEEMLFYSLGKSGASPGET